MPTSEQIGQINSLDIQELNERLRIAQRLIDENNDNFNALDFNSYISGTANQVNVVSNNNRTVTLSIPQDVNIDASPTFNNLNINQITARTTDGLKLYDDGGNGIFVKDGGNVGIGTASPQAKIHIDQSSTTAAIPALTLDQADVSEEMIEFVTTIGVGNAIEAIGAKTLTTTHFIKVTIPGGLTRYIPCGTIA